jgi:hypothetical protein
MCDKPLQSALAALGGGGAGGGLGLLAGLGFVETAVLAGGLAGVADVTVGVARPGSTPVVEPIVAARSTDGS